MNEIAKTITSFEPFKSLNLEQEKTDIELDFRVLEYKIYAYNGKNLSNIYSFEELDVFDDDEFYLKQYDVLSQQYLIEFYPKSENNSFRFILETNKNITKVKAKFVCDEALEYYEGIKNDIMQALYKAMLKNKMLILRLNKKLDFYLDIFIETLRQGKQNLEPLQFMLCEGIEPLACQESKDIIHKKITENDDFQPVSPNFLLFEHIYGKIGRKGRDMCGNFIDFEHINIENPFKIKDESIYEDFTETSVKYYSACYGFLFKDAEGYYSITDTLKVHNAFLENYNKGHLEADTVYIKNLSHSKVNAKNIYVERCTESIIEAENIFIENLFNGNKLYPKKNLVIQNKCRIQNTINITSTSVFPGVDLDKEYQDIRNLSYTMSMDFKKISGEMKKLYDYLIANQARIIKLKKYIQDNERSGGYSTYLTSINMYNDNLQKYEELVKKYEEFAKLKYQVDYRMETLQRVFFNVKIYIPAKEIDESNIIRLKIGKFNSKYILGAADKQKHFYCNYEQKEIRITDAYSEQDINNIKDLFKSVRGFQQ